MSYIEEKSNNTNLIRYYDIVNIKNHEVEIIR